MYKNPVETDEAAKQQTHGDLGSQRNLAFPAGEMMGLIEYHVRDVNRIAGILADHGIVMRVVQSYHTPDGSFRMAGITPDRLIVALTMGTVPEKVEGGNT